jgi:hypothetical protein
MSLKLRKPSPALVVALIALFVALGGSAVAAGIVPHARLADHAKVADKATTAAKAGVAANSLKLNGQTAAQIVASVPAPPAPTVTSVASLASVVSAPFTLNAQTEANVTATCPAGSKAVGGGFNNPTNALVIEAGSSPTADGTGWVEDLINLSTSTTGTGSAVVTCLK